MRLLMVIKPQREHVVPYLILSVVGKQQKRSRELQLDLLDYNGGESATGGEERGGEGAG